MDEKLKSCPTPWCSEFSHAYLQELPPEVGHGAVWHEIGFQVRCGACNVRGPRELSEAEAIAAWNTRSPSDRNDVIEECASIADAKVQYAAQHPNNPLVQAEGVARDIAAAIRARKD